MSKFVWHDLMTTDVEKSKRFYGELFNWRMWAGEGGGPYLHISVGKKDIGGMMSLDPKHGAPPHWVGYIQTGDVDGVISKLKAAGGQVYMPAEDMPKVGRFAVVADPQGGVFSPFKPLAGTMPEVAPVARPEPGEFCWDELLVGDPVKAVAFYEGLFGWTHQDSEMPGMGTYRVLKEGEAMVAGVMKTAARCATRWATGSPTSPSRTPTPPCSGWPSSGAGSYPSR